jgi:HK97 family phage prohead protease
VPYYITDKSADCPSWAVVKEDGELIACHASKESAIDQALAISLAEETEFVGERAAVGQLKVGDYVSWDLTNPKIMAEVVMIEGELAGLEVYELEDDVYHSTDRLMIMNVFKLIRVPRPEKISEEVEMEEDYSEEDREEGTPAIILDVDNTIIRGGQINQQLVDYLDTFDDTEMIIITARLESERAETEAELEGFDYDQLLMKPSADLNSTEFKRRTASELMNTYNLMIAIDDNNDILRAYRGLGITAIHPNEIPSVPEEDRAEPDALEVGDSVSWNSSGGRARGVIERIERNGRINVPDSDFTITGTEDDPAALIRVYRAGEEGLEPTDTLVGHKFSTLTKIEDLDETRDVNLTPPAYMRAAARRGLEYYREGKGGDGLVDRTIREARAMAEGNVTADKWVRIRAWIARHLVDLDAPDANPSSDNYPSAGVVAHLLWGSGPSKSSARRTLKYAEGVVARLEEENRASISQESEQMAKIEKRTNEVQFELRAVEGGDGMTFTGYAAVFNSPSEPLPFIERIAPGAFKRSLRARNDIKLLWNHDTGSVLGSTRAGTLKLEEDNYGLRVTAVLPETTLGKDVRTLVQRGDVNAMSFGFSVPANGDSWNTEGTERTLRSVRIHEVSIVAFPAYSQTAGTASVRSFDAVATRAEVDADQLADAMLTIEDGKDLSKEQSELLTKVIQRLTPQDDANGESEELTALELKKMKLELLMKRL